MNLNTSLRNFRTSMRRLSFIAAVSLTAAALAGPSAKAADFVARDATRFAENPDLSSYGLPDVIVAYEGSLWPAGASKVQPDLNHIRTKYIPKIRSKNPDVVIFDIETWPIKTTMTAAEITAIINKYKKIVTVFRQEMPNTKLAFYLTMPSRNWSAPCGDPKKVASRTASWRNHNLKFQPLADVVDIIVPSLYTFYADAKSVACWPTYAKANIAEARIYGKPVWAFLWMKYHTTGALIPAPFWRTQLETVHANADGVVIWSQAKATDTWSWTAPWWVETAKFLKEKGLAPLTN